MAEGYVQLPTDGSGKKIRLLQVSEQQSDNSGAVTEYQEVVALADANGNLFAVVEGGSLSTADDEIRVLLRAICMRLDLIGAELSKDYAPPDDYGYGDD
jgi:hypothetical protein